MRGRVKSPEREVLRGLCFYSLLLFLSLYFRQASAFLSLHLKHVERLLSGGSCTAQVVHRCSLFKRTYLARQMAWCFSLFMLFSYPFELFEHSGVDAVRLLPAVVYPGADAVPVQPFNISEADE